MKSREKELKELLDYIDSAYVGDYAGITLDLYQAIYYLHFLEKDMIPQHIVQDISFALHKLGECFFRAHRKQRRRERLHLRQTLQDIEEVLKG